MKKATSVIFLLFKSIMILGCLFTSSACKSIRNQPVDNAMGKPVHIKVSTFNIRYNANADVESGNGWDIRKKPVADLIKRHGFEIVGTQEGDKNQLADLQQLMPEFAITSYPYGGKGDLHNCAILYKKGRFELVDQGVFWLSETPNEPSIGWDATDRRICNWAKFKEKKSGKEFYYFNVHFYWRLEIAKRESGPLMVKMMKEIAGESPVICVGDFNSEAQTPQIKAVKSYLKDAFEATEQPRKGIVNTNLGGGNFLGPATNRIDYIFISNHIKVKDYEVFSDRYNTDRYPSDHLPVAANIMF